MTIVIFLVSIDQTRGSNIVRHEGVIALELVEAGQMYELRFLSGDPVRYDCYDVVHMQVHA